MLLQASAEVPSYEAFRDAMIWLNGQVAHPEGFVSLEVFQAHGNPNRVTFVERWESVEAFEQAFAKYDMEQRAEFLQRAGIDPEKLSRDLWIESDVPTVFA
ncbi:MAG TPA: antibiotic biosynthesis monooxygenase [Acidimicrobiales bacterium]|nr:antibiotic biosynthesis monooxygenase [Acidimicrobiales bacterium]